MRVRRYSATDEERPMGSTAEDQQYIDLRYGLVEGLQRRGIIADARLSEAFATVPRHLFLPGLDPERVYSDQAIITKEQDGIGISSSSQPAMMAIMLGQLGPEPGQRLLEIGAGTGYNAALLRFLVGPRGRVTTVDVDDDIVAAARAQTAAAGYPDIHVVLGDGGYGYADDAPYDRIILTVGASDLLPAWWEQLRPSGLLVLPLSLGPGMFSVAFRHQSNGTLISESLSPCGFIRLRGAFASAERTVLTTGWEVSAEPGPRLDLDRLPALFAQPTRTIALPAETTTAHLFLAFAGGPLGRLARRAPGGQAEFETSRHAILDTAALSGCTLPGWQDPTITQFGAPDAVERLHAWLAHWDALGRPALGDLRVIAVPRVLAAPPTGVMAIRRTHATFLLTGRDGRPLPAPRGNG
jgi:protein-L-isoaspartate(D-aspartate) O-methyltransferase